MKLTTSSRKKVAVAACLTRINSIDHAEKQDQRQRVIDDGAYADARSIS
mgnify:CR=1 FL=1